jgi:RNA polymerase sigma factor (sigma-70 family)
MQLVLSGLRRAALLSDGAGLTDAQLLGRFVADRDESAFEALVRRHGPMVLGVCRRLAGHAHDAEDAFQVTFLVLARKAGSIDMRELLGNWLYGVACRTARKARVAGTRRRSREGSLEDHPYMPAEPDVDRQEWRTALDEEVAGLPEKYRVPVVLCEFEGRARREVACQLNVPEGTLSSRLAAARKLLARRLTRRGFILPAAFAAMAWGPGLAGAGVPASLVESTIRSAALVTAGKAMGSALPAGVAALMQGVTTAMWFSKMKLGIAVLLTLGLLGAGAWSLREARAGDGPEKPKPSAAKPNTDKPSADKSAKPDKPKKPQGASVHGVVAALDTDKKIITLHVHVEGEKRTEEKSFPVAADAQILLEDVVIKDKNQPLPKGTLADLSEGTWVAAELSADGKSITGIHARGPSVFGTIKAVNAATPAITILARELKGSGKENKTTVQLSLDVDKDAKVFIDDGLGNKKEPPKEGKLSDLAEDTRVVVQLSVDRKTALGIRAQGATLNGTVAGYDAGNRTLTVTVKEDAGVVDKTLTLAKEAKVDGNVVQGARVAVQLSFADKTVATVVRVVDN